MTRRTAISALLGAALKPAAARTTPPNIVFILADDLGWGDLGCYGHPELPTPNLDRLAHEGTLFTQFYVANPVCSPSRTALLTGHFPARHRVHSIFSQMAPDEPKYLDPTVPSVARLLKNAGYSTAHFGKWHLGSGQGAPDPYQYGFDECRSANANGPGWEDWQSRSFRSRSTALFADEAIRFAGNNRTRPFYIQMWAMLPHAVLYPTEEQMKPFERYAPAKGLLKGAKQYYYASVADLDRQIGRLVQSLDQMGLRDRTLFLFSSDNGPEDIHVNIVGHSGIGSPGPFRGRKRSLYEGGTRVPFLARWPGVVPAGRVENRACLGAVDLLPTAAALAGAAVPAAWKPDGEDVSDILRGASRDRRRTLMWEWRYPVIGHVSGRSPMLAIRERNWKLLVNPDGSRPELYDIPNDPGETNNLAGRQPAVVRRLKARLMAWKAELPGGPVDPDAGRNDYPWPKGIAR